MPFSDTVLESAENWSALERVRGEQLKFKSFPKKNSCKPHHPACHSCTGRDSRVVAVPSAVPRRPCDSTCSPGGPSLRDTSTGTPSTSTARSHRRHTDRRRPCDGSPLRRWRIWPRFGRGSTGRITFLVRMDLTRVFGERIGVLPSCASVTCAMTSKGSSACMIMIWRCFLRRITKFAASQQ